MLPELPETLGTDTLRLLFRDLNPDNAITYGITLADPSLWDRYRKYAFARYWERRIASAATLSDDEIAELCAALQVELVAAVATGLIGDAGRQGVLTREHIETCLRLVPADGYAGRQLRARRLLLDRPSPGDAEIEEFLSLRTPWALRELVNTAAGESELQKIEGHLDDKRLSRIHRHSLREEIRSRRRILRVER